MTDTQRLEVGPSLFIELVSPDELHEQSINAQVMDPRREERLAANIAARGQLESVPYCSRPNDVGPRWIISGHHRVRKARQVGIAKIPILLDVLPMTRSEVRAKQVAHNELTGHSDPEILRHMVAEITTADDLLTTGLDESFLSAAAEPSPVLTMPAVAVEWRAVALAFLPAQFEDVKALVDALDGSQQLLGLAPLPEYAAFAAALGKFARIKEIRNMSTAIAVLTRTALAAIAEHEKMVEDAETT